MTPPLRDTASAEWERQLLLGALDEDAALSAAERVQETAGASLGDILLSLADLADAGLVCLYSYAPAEAASPSEPPHIRPANDPGALLRAAAHAPATLGYELFLATTEQTLTRLKALEHSRL
ncbi:hypothetical protein GCM10007301_24900 [Azorhizobium oxalatiphilum]|uniref:Uncharacterized protein n=2 Tax=Azorhizobium oxalatiphilum TaxID=980631 RepID=A0A917FC74_9HYPH|nr:hypothetical protein GCM10007301_24900 [Azorhizobium oxalatiphilum]